MKPQQIFCSILLVFSLLTAFHSLFWVIGSIITTIIILIDLFAGHNNSSVLFFGFSLNPLKKTFTEWGTFYVEMYEDDDYDNRMRIRVYKRIPLAYHKLNDFSYTGLDDMKRQIEYSVEKHCGERHRAKAKKSNALKELKDWNGAINTQIDRDNKLNQLI